MYSAIAEDPNTVDVSQITLSYTFYVDEEKTQELRRTLAAAPDHAPAPRRDAQGG